MIQITSIIPLNRNAELNIMNRNILKEKRGGIEVVFLGIVLICLFFYILVNMIDYGLYSLKVRNIKEGIDYSVLAAIQEVDINNSTGLATEYDSQGRVNNLDNISINETAADNAFYSTLYQNTHIAAADLQNNILIAITNPKLTDIEYIIKTNTRSTGTVINPDQIENIINNAANNYWVPGSEATVDDQLIYVNGNTKTTQFKKRPYYFVFIKNYEVDGLFKKRTATFIGFAGAKMERKSD